MPDIAPNSVSEIERIQENSFRIYRQVDSIFLKWIKHNDIKGQNEIQKYLNSLNPDEICIPRLLGQIRNEDGILGVWEYLDGSDLRENNRSRIPEAFRALGAFHLRHVSQTGAESEITNSIHASISDMLDYEVRIISKISSDSMIQDCRDILRILESGFVTLTHGDIHPGNLILSRDRICFVDWGYSRYTLNFSDLGYLWDRDICNEVPEGWWMIKEAARDSLQTYLDAIEKGSLSLRELMLAVMIRSQLYSYSNAIRNELKDAIIGCRKRLNCLIRVS